MAVLREGKQQATEVARIARPHKKRDQLAGIASWSLFLWGHAQEILNQKRLPIARQPLLFMYYLFIENQHQKRLHLFLHQTF